MDASDPFNFDSTGGHGTSVAGREHHLRSGLGAIYVKAAGNGFGDCTGRMNGTSASARIHLITPQGTRAVLNQVFNEPRARYIKAPWVSKIPRTVITRALAAMTIPTKISWERTISALTPV